VEEAGKELEQSQPLSQGTKEQQADYYQYLGAVHTRQQKWDQALQDLQKAIELDPMEPYNHYHIGIAYGKSNRPDKMVEHLEMFLKLAPDAPEAPKAKAVLSAVQ
jgi:tetratricopeptide (TPR) repeat protein